MKAPFQVLLLCLVSLHQTLFADELVDLYETEVIARSDSQADRLQSFQQAMQIVLTRIIAGQSDMQDFRIKKMIREAQHYVEEYQYSLAGVAGSESENSRMLRVQFDEKQLVETLRAEQLGFWNEIRPRTLVWLVVEKNGQTSFLDRMEMPEVYLEFLGAAKQKGLPLVFPIQDLNENKLLSIHDVLSPYSNRLLDVSSRYDVVSTLAGKISQQSMCWEGEWSFYFDGKIFQWRSGCESLATVALGAMQGAYQKLSDYYGIIPHSSQVNTVVLKVSNIPNSIDEARLSQYLESLRMVKTATRVKRKAGYSIYRVFYSGTSELFHKQLVADHVIKPEDFSTLAEREVNYLYIRD